MKRAAISIVSLVLCLATVVTAGSVSNQTAATSRPVKGSTPFQLAIWPPVQILDKDYEVTGLRLSIPVGQNRSMYGLDLGLLATMTGEKGSPGEVRGIQYATGANDVVGNVAGVQIAGMINKVEGTVTGVQSAFLVNEVREAFTGIQIGAFINIAHKTLKGLQVAIFNEQEEETEGLQFGAINTTGGGFQIGLLNYNRRGVLPWMAVCNFSYRSAEPARAKENPETALEKEVNVTADDLQAGPSKANVREFDK